ncbi:MAG: hypothetical protein KDD10_17120 [Phaeodactylibacter sp.]|nr:hypothetical protein [Phaeodactylibacter sp.]MCB9292568.1 hypothetical protein [Lewinellaceae bacterium]
MVRKQVADLNFGGQAKASTPSWVSSLCLIAETGNLFFEGYFVVVISSSKKTDHEGQNVVTIAGRAVAGC